MCNHCNAQRLHTINVFGKYFYLYWIPFFPMGKKANSECTHCKVNYAKNEMTDALKRASDNVILNTKTPLRHWFGLLSIGVVFLGFIGLIISSASTYEQRQLDLTNRINNPSIGDIVEQKIKRKEYSTLKITKVTPDSVYVIANELDVTKKYKLYKIDKEENYTGETYGMTLTEYKDFFTSEDFFDVNR